MGRGSEMKEGIFYLNGERMFFLSADYPYYRDSVDNWVDRLKKLKAAHVRVISFYVPWRHHTVASEVDFTGKYAANKNVLQFIRLCKDMDLYVLLKPGPFIHAETDYGGLPDFVDPDLNSELEPMLNGLKEKRKWHKTLPAPVAPVFDGMVREWYSSVYEHLIQPNQYPEGPIISVQILNEGIYSDAQHPVTEYDYSASSVALFQRFLEERYGDLNRYNELHSSTFEAFAIIEPPSQKAKISQEADILLHMDWAEYQSYLMSDLYQNWGDYLQTKLPSILNLNPPHDRKEGYDDWFNRLEIEKFKTQQYGYTNWIGVVSHDPSAFNRYLLLTKRGRGPNLEENWGFSKLYDYRYRYPAIPFFQTVMAIAGGATGYNLYTGVGTDQWDDGIDTMQAKPYPDCAPISENGELTPAYHSVKLLNRFMQEFGSEILTCETEAPLTWGIYNRYAQIGCWGMEDDIRSLGRKSIHLGNEGFDHFQTAVRKYNIDYHLINLASGVPSLEKHPFIVLVGGFFMEEAVQRHLIEYVRLGGTLLLCHDLPVLDENMLPCTILKETLFGEKWPEDGCYDFEKGKVAFLNDNLFVSEEASEGLIRIALSLNPTTTSIVSDAQVWSHIHPTKDIAYYFVLGMEAEEKEYSISHRSHEFRIHLPKKSSAILRVEAGVVTAGVIKGVHEFEESQAAPCVSWGEYSIRAGQPCDLFFCLEGLEPVFEAATIKDGNSVTIEIVAPGFNSYTVVQGNSHQA